MAATTGFVAGGARPARILALWTAVALVSATASAIGYAALGDASVGWIAYVQAFAAGAILTMLADTMMPEAFEHGGRSPDWRPPRVRAGVRTVGGRAVRLTRPPGTI